MRLVRADREQAAAQLGRSLKAWQASSGRAAQNPKAPIPDAAGSPLPDEARSTMERKLGADLSSVRIHTGAESAAAADGLGARAFTVGQDVHFASGEYHPGTKEGDRLLAHELTHTVQGARGGVQRKADGDGGENDHGAAAAAEVSQPHEPAEQEADSVGDQVAESLHGGEQPQAENAAGQQPQAIGAEAKATQIAAKLKPGVVVHTKKGDKKSPPQGRKNAKSDFGKGKDAKSDFGKGKDAKADLGNKDAGGPVPIKGKGGDHFVDVEEKAGGYIVGIDHAPVAAKINQAIQTALAKKKEAEGTEAAKEIATELADLRAALRSVQDLEASKKLTADALQARKVAVARELNEIAIKYEYFSIGEAGNVILHGNKRMPLCKPAKWKCNKSKYDEAEYRRQVKDQEAGTNAMRVSAWQKNKDKFNDEGRSKKGTQMQRDFGKKTGIKGSTPKMAAPHNPDQVGSGFPDPTGKPVLADINSSIGSQWKAESRRGKIVAACDAIPKSEWPTTQMNVEFDVEVVEGGEEAE